MRWPRVGLGLVALAGGVVGYVLLFSFDGRVGLGVFLVVASYQIGRVA